MLHALACLSPFCILEIYLVFPRFKHLPLTEVKGNMQADFRSALIKALGYLSDPHTFTHVLSLPVAMHMFAPTQQLPLTCRNHMQLHNREHFSKRCQGA